MLIAKQWGGIYHPCEDVKKRLSSFFAEHSGCFPSAEDGFEVVYENSFEGKIVNTEDGEYWNPPD